MGYAKTGLTALSAKLAAGNRTEAIRVMTENHTLMKLLTFDEIKAREQADEENKDKDLFALAIADATAEPFDEAREKLAEMAADPSKQTVDMLWSIGQNIKDGEKLVFVADELKKAGFEGLSTILSDQTTWDGFSEKPDQFAAAALACKQARDEIIAMGDMNKYLGSSQAIRTPRLSILRKEGPYFWPAILLGYPILGVWYWCSDQTIVQRVLGAKDQLNAQNGALFAGLLKVTPVFLMVLPGTVAYIIMRDKIGDETAKTLPIMISELMPRGLKGLMAAALMAALMSTIAAALSSVGTQVAGAEWISDARVGLGIPFMMQAVYMFLIWSVLYVVVSLATPAPPPEQVENTTWPNPLAVLFRGRLIGWYDPRLLTAVLVVLMLVLYWVFR